MKKSNEQKMVIREILENAKEVSGRTAAEIVAWSRPKGARTVFYRAKDGEASDEVMICVFLGCDAPAKEFLRYLRACSISLSKEFRRDKIILDYVSTNDMKYDVFTLNDMLMDAGEDPLFIEELEDER